MDSEPRREAEKLRSERKAKLHDIGSGHCSTCKCIEALGDDDRFESKTMWPLREKHRALVEEALKEGKLETRCALCKRSAADTEVFKKATSIGGGGSMVGECLECWAAPLCFDCAMTHYVAFKPENNRWNSTYSLVGVRCLRCACHPNFQPLTCALCKRQSPHKEAIPPLKKTYTSTIRKVEDYIFSTIFAPLSEGNEPGTHGSKRIEGSPDIRGSVPCDSCGRGPLCDDCYVGRNCALVYCLVCSKAAEEKKISEEKQELIESSKRKPEESAMWPFLYERSKKKIKKSEDEIAEKEQFVARLRERIDKLPAGSKESLN